MFSSRRQRDPYPKRGIKPAIAARTLTSCHLCSLKEGGCFSWRQWEHRNPTGRTAAEQPGELGWGEELGALANPCFNVDGAGESSGIASDLPLGPCIPAASLAEPHTVPFVPVRAAVGEQILVLALGVSTALPYLMADVTSPTPACSPKSASTYLVLKL